jgi:hypothetical protein
MAWAESTTELRYLQNRREAFLKRIIEAGRQFEGVGDTDDQLWT